MEKNDIEKKKINYDKSLIISILAMIVSFLLLFTSLLLIFKINLFKFKGATNTVGTVVSDAKMTGYPYTFGDGGGADYNNALANAKKYGKTFGKNYIYYPDPEYGNVRMVAGDPRVNSYGSILEVTFTKTGRYKGSYKLDYNSSSSTKTFKVIVIDSGVTGKLLDLKIDPGPKKVYFEGMGNVPISYKVLRVGYYKGSTTKATTTTKEQNKALTLNCPSVMKPGIKDYCYTNQNGVTMKVSGCTNSASNTYVTKDNDFSKYMRCSNTGTVTVTASKNGIVLTRKIKLSSKLTVGVKMQNINTDLDNSDVNVNTYNLNQTDFGSDLSKRLYIRFSFINAKNKYIRWFSYKTNDVNGELLYNGMDKNICVPLKSNDSLPYTPYLLINKNSSGGSGLIKVYSTQSACRNDSNSKSNTDVLATEKVIYNVLGSNGNIGDERTTTTTVAKTTTSKKTEFTVSGTEYAKSSSVNKISDGYYEVKKSSLTKNGTSYANNFTFTPSDNSNSYYVRWFTYKGINSSSGVSFNTLQSNYCVAVKGVYSASPSLTLTTSTNNGRYGIYKAYKSQSACKNDTNGTSNNDVISKISVTYKIVNSFSVATTKKTISMKMLKYDSDAILKDIGTQIDTVHEDSSYSASFAYGIYIISDGKKIADKVMEDPSKAPTVYGAVRANQSGKTVNDKTYFNNIKAYIDKGIPLSAPYLDKNGERHYILIVGYNQNATSTNYDLDDFYGIDSFYDINNLNVNSGIKLKEGKIKSDLGYEDYYKVNGVKQNPWTWLKASDIKEYDNPKWPNDVIKPNDSVSSTPTTNKYLGEVNGYYLLNNYIKNDHTVLGLRIGSQIKVNDIGQCLQACYAYALYILTNGESAKTSVSVNPGLNGTHYTGNSKQVVNAKIKEQIDNGYPVALHVSYKKSNGSEGQHWQLVVGYKATATDPSKWTDQDIYVVDPYNGYGNNDPLRHGPLVTTKNLIYSKYHDDLNLRLMDNIINAFNSKYNSNYKVNLLTN